MRRASLAVILSSTFLLAACCDPPLIGSVNVPITGQQTNLWCWAASGQMVMNFVRPASNVTQGDEANRRLGRTDCLNSPIPAACVRTGWPEFEKYDFAFQRTSNAALSWNDLRKEIGCARRPFAFSWAWNNGGGHMMVVVGYAAIGDQRFVSINDPLPVDEGSQRVIPYDEYVSGSSYTHWDDFHHIRYEGD
jgi:hypothetical protein